MYIYVYVYVMYIPTIYICIYIVNDMVMLYAENKCRVVGIV